MPGILGGIIGSSIKKGDGTIITSNLRLNLDAGLTSSYSGSGTTWNDLSGNGLNATLINGVSFSTDGGGCLQLDGINDYISMSTSGFAPASSSLELWVKKDTGDTDGYVHIIDSSDNPENRISMTTTQLLAQIYDDGAYRLNSTVNISTDTWYHIVVTLTNNQQRLYLNNSLALSATGQYTGSSNGNAGEQTIGTYNRPATGYGGYWKGKVASCRFYTAVLSQEQVTQNFNARKWRYGL